MRSIITLGLSTTLAMALLLPASASASVTLDHLQEAYNGESNASARYVAFAKRADADGYASVASLFRAAARAEEIHAANHAAVIQKLGATPNATVKTARDQEHRRQPQGRGRGGIVRARHDVSAVHQGRTRGR